MKNLLFISIISTLMFFSCVPDKIFPDTQTERPPVADTLPAITTAGLNTFGCLVNDSVWVPRVPPFAGWSGVHELTVSYSPQIDRLTLKAQKWRDSLFVSQIYISGNITVGKDSFKIKGIPSIWLDEKGSYSLDTFSNYAFQLLKFDLDSRVASGTFGFTAINEETNDTLTISQGRYDVNF